MNWEFFLGESMSMGFDAATAIDDRIKEGAAPQADWATGSLR